MITHFFFELGNDYCTPNNSLTSFTAQTESKMRDKLGYKKTRQDRETTVHGAVFEFVENKTKVCGWNEWMDGGSVVYLVGRLVG